MGALCLGKQSPPSLWSDLPAELAGLVLCGLPSHADRLCFRAVCRQWRLAAKQQYPLPPPALPWLRLNLETFQSLPDGHLSRCTSLGFSSPVCTSDGWLLCLRSTPTAKLFLTNPFTKATIQLILPDNCVNSLGGFFAMAQLQKMVVCSDDLVAAIFHGGDVCYYRAGAPSWLVCTNDRREGQYYEDIAFHHGKLYAVTTREDLFAFDASDSEVSNVEHAIKAVQPHPATNQGMLPLIKRYLVTSCGKLLMVKLINHDVCFCPFVTGSGIMKRIEVKVFEAELTTGRWVEVKKLDDGQALFVSRGCSKAIPLSGHELGFQGNRVYFLGVELFSLFSEIKRADIPTCCFYDMTAGTNTAVFFKRGGDTRDLYTQEN
ncbi:unnamed protein product [Urochloa decumbens]|uniref:KIB1-4 beta-propeller domain-containing protein n=1 Tax=Urochloa decumbens TaxID=240449 RepID=A0ABC9E9L1_9POAL